jgi:hypothetical protein
MVQGYMESSVKGAFELFSATPVAHKRANRFERSMKKIPRFDKKKRIDDKMKNERSCRESEIETSKKERKKKWAHVQIHQNPPRW